MTKFLKKYKAVLIIGVLLILFVLMSILLKNTSVPIKGNEDLSTWVDDAKNNEFVVTVVGASWCSNCQVYKPIMQTVKDKYDLNVYFFEADLLGEEEEKIVSNTFELTDRTDGIPYTAVISKGKVIANHTGRMSKNDLIKFLKEAGVIK